jgi:hypothetical protein
MAKLQEMRALEQQHVAEQQAALAEEQRLRAEEQKAQAEQQRKLAKRLKTWFIVAMVAFAVSLAAGILAFRLRIKPVTPLLTPNIRPKMPKGGWPIISVTNPWQIGRTISCFVYCLR